MAAKSEIECLIAMQYGLEKKMANFMRNYKKDSSRRKTLSYFEKRLKLFTDYWDEFKVNNNKLEILPVDENESYLKDDLYSKIEDFYIDSYSEIEEDMKQSFPQTKTVKLDPKESNSTQVSVKDPSCELKLPPIQMPVFNGQYENWCSFRDLFTSMIHQNESLNDVQRLYYLKTQVSGEAERLIKHFDVVGTNYITAWNILTDRFENTRVLVNVQLKRLFSQPKVLTDNALGVKSLLDTTQECISALQNLKVRIENWDPILIYLVSQRLPQETLQLWEQHISHHKEFPSFEILKTFLTGRFRALEALKDQSRSVTKFTPSKSNFHVTKLSCKFCYDDHLVNKCPILTEKSHSERLNFVKNKNVCFNCLSASHSARQCPSKNSCNTCKKRHHTLLHEAISKHWSSSFNQNFAPPAENAHSPIPKVTHHEVEVSHATRYNAVQTVVLLSTAIVKVSDSRGNELVVRALLDQGSQCTFVSENLAQRLKLKRERIAAKVSGIGKNQISCFRTSGFSISSMNSEIVVPKVQALMLKHLTGYSPKLEIKDRPWDHIKQLILADPNFGNPGKIDLIIGADLYPSILMDGCLRGPPNTPLAQNTKFGWILTGPVNPNLNSETKTREIVMMHTCSDIHDQLRSFWELEEVSPTKHTSIEDELCEKIYQDTHSRVGDRYTVNLPFKENAPALGESLPIAISQFRSLERRLNSNPELKEQYSNCLQEYLTLNHMRRLNSEEIRRSDNEGGFGSYYLPHHPVFKEESSTTKLRIVFNASQKTDNGVSLNDRLLTGPNIQENLSAILQRWRMHKFAYVADIEKMYRQIRINDDHTNYQRIIWRESPKEPIEHFKLLTVTFGMESSAFLAIRTLKQLAFDEKPRFPIGANAIENEFYVDNLMSGADTIEEASEKQDQIIKVLESGGFTLRKWVSNEADILTNVHEDDREKKTLQKPSILILNSKL